VITLWEAFLTFAFFPILVVLAYLVDKNCFCKKTIREQVEEGEQLGTDNKLSNFLPWNRKKHKKAKQHSEKDGAVDEEQMRDIIKELRAIHPNLTEDEIIQLATAKLAEEQPRDRLWYRINAMKQIGGNPKLTPKVDTKLSKVYDYMKKHDATGKPEDFGSIVDMSDGSHKAVIEFTATQSAILEREERVSISIRRGGRLNCQVSCKIETIDGSAEATKDYIAINQTLTFEPDELVKNIDIAIIDDNEWEPDEVFFVKLSLDPEDPNSKGVVIGKRAIQEITILNDDDPGVFEFEKPSFLFKESEGTAQIPIVRSNGADGQVTLRWKTEDLTAVCGRDYIGGEGSITFAHGETSKILEIPIVDDQVEEKNESFKVDLFEVDCEGAKIGRIRKTIVTIVDDDEFSNMVNRMMLSVNMNMDAMRVDASTWADQFRNAMNVNGGDVDSATTLDYVMHFLTFGWKLIFALVPPPYILNGWLAFFVSLLLIGLLTAIVGDLAAIFGCLVGLKDSVTSITFVALGTSLPDLFASKQAAIMEKTADNAIGNVMGSNSVNVFLGLGMPWLMAAIYWQIKEEPFRVPVGSLGFSIIVYVIGATICMAMLLIKRFSPCMGRAELGGPTAVKFITAGIFFILWLIYILLSSLQAYSI
jgi:solute carrier family 8 (sodium/calcium exchanger)